MKKKVILIIILTLSFNLFCQEKRNINRRYLKIEDYRKKFPKKTIKLTDGKYLIHKKDTLILIEDKKFLNAKSVIYEAKDSTFLEIYKDVVYKKFSNKKENSSRKQYMRLWNKPVKIFFASSLDNYYKKIISEASQDLSKKIDSLNISVVDDVNDANYIIYQINNENSVKYSQNIKNNKYINYYIFWKKNRIYDTKLEVNLTNYKNLSKEIHANYILQNFYQTLGRFFKTDKLPCNSMFSICNRNNKKLTAIDFELLKYHYSYGICKYTDLKTFEENHARAKEVIKKGNIMRFTHID